MANDSLPYYIFFNHRPLEHFPTHSSPSPHSAYLGHPTIQYLYANDSPTALLPRHPDEHVLVLDYNPNAITTNDEPTAQSRVSVRSLSSKMAVTGVKTAEDNGETIYIVHTTATPLGPQTHGAMSTSSMLDGSTTAQGSLATFKKRNDLLRRALAYPRDLNPGPPVNAVSEPVSS